MLLLGIRSSEDCQTKLKTIATEHPNPAFSDMAIRRINIRAKWYQQFGDVHVAAKGTIVCFSLFSDCVTFNECRLYGQSSKIYGNCIGTNRKIACTRE